MAKKQDDAAKAAAAASVDSTKAADESKAKAAASNPVPAEPTTDPVNAVVDGKAETVAAKASAPANPAAATELEQPSGAIIEPEITGAVDVAHESVDANPRAGTTSEQNAIDWNDAKRARPGSSDFTGQGLDETVYGKGAKA